MTQEPHAKQPAPAKPCADLTIFRISCGYNPNADDCLAAIQAQTAVAKGAKIKLIHNIAPMSRAFQAMIDTCQTRYYLQVDEDMLLYPDSAEKMLDFMHDRNENSRCLLTEETPAFAAFMLHDAHLDMIIQGVKIYDREIMVQYPYNLEIISCEKDQLNRLLHDGHRVAESPVVVGEHSPKWTPELIFERYFDLMEKWKLYGYTWLENMPNRLLEKYLDDRSEINYFAWRGAQMSADNPEPMRNREKDFRVRTKEYLQARSWFSQPTQATLYMTDKCNLKCGWCLRQGDMVKVASAPDFDATIVDELVRRFPTITAICLCGFGEPLLNVQLAGIIDRCKRHNLWIGLITNGLLLEAAWPTLLEHRPNSISISLNAATAEEHAAECGVPGAWDEIMAGIVAVRYHRKNLAALHAADRGIPLFLSRVCTAQNLDGIPAFLKLATDLGIVDGVDLHNILPHDVGTPEKEAAFLQLALTIQHRREIEDLKRHPGARLVRSWPTLIDPDVPVRRCEYPFQAISVNGARNVGFCNSVMPPNHSSGTIRDAKCWHNPAAEALRLSFAEPELPAWCKWCFRNFC